MNLERNEKLRIPVTAPAGGYQYQIVSEKTDWQRYSDTYLAYGRPQNIRQLGYVSRHISARQRKVK